MMTRRMLMLGVFLGPALSWAAPAPKPAAKVAVKSISIDPAAKVILERVAKLYGATPKWKGQIVQQPSRGGVVGTNKYRYDISYARPNQLRIEEAYNQRLFVDVFVDDELRGLSGYPLADFGVELYTFLRGKTGLEEAQAQIKEPGGRSLLIKRLPDASWKGRTCQRVLIEKQFQPTDDEPTQSTRSEWWVTPEGKWVRHIRTRKVKSFDPRIPRDGIDVYTGEFTAQNFAPTFGPRTFVQPPPPSMNF